MFEIQKSKLKGCLKIIPKTFVDQRGQFTKVFHETTFKGLGLETEFKEEYFSVSHEGVLRGMHFQTPPEDHSKLVYCSQGSVLDVVLDIRRGSPTYGQFEAFTLTGEKGECLYIPRGFAHGFFTTSAQAIMTYKVTSMHNPSCDEGISWNSFGMKWPTQTPILSARDSNFKEMQNFNSPFDYYD